MVVGALWISCVWSDADAVDAENRTKHELSRTRYN